MDYVKVESNNFKICSFLQAIFIWKYHNSLDINMYDLSHSLQLLYQSQKPVQFSFINIAAILIQAFVTWHLDCSISLLI